MQKQLLLKILFWFASEILLNLAGLDDLADYSEFLAQTQSSIQGAQIQMLVSANG